jgi:hypothetical protein
VKTPTRSLLVALTLAAAHPAFGTLYSGNGATNNTTQGAFNGAVGSGSLTLTDDGTTIFGTFTRGTESSTTASFNNNLVIYLDTVAGGFADTSGFKDTADGSRKAISGYNSATQNSVMTFAPGFLPDYGISLRSVSGDSFGGLWQLANGGANSLGFKQNVSLSPLNNSSAASYTFSFSLANAGLLPGQSFSLFATFVSNTGNRSAECIAGDDIANTAPTTLKGFVPFTQTAFSSYTTTVPEPSVAALLGIASAAALTTRRRRK